MTMRHTDPRKRERGQVLVIFAGAVILLMALSAVVVDVSWYWVNTLRVQRAADAAALAGAVMLPERKSDAYQLAYDEAKRNGFVPVPAPSSRRSRTRATRAGSTSRSAPRSARSSCASSASTPSASRETPRPSSSCRCPWAARRTTTAWASTRARPASSAFRIRGAGPSRRRGSGAPSSRRAASAKTATGMPRSTSAAAWPGSPRATQPQLRRRRLRLHGRAAAATGQIKLFDPIFCGTGGNGHGGSYGAGDHWTDTPPGR